MTRVGKWQNWPFCRGHSKARWSKNVYLESELERAKNIQEVTQITLQLFYSENRLKTQ